MNREEKLAAIYKEMADKELTFGCKITTNEYNGDEFRISTSDSLAVKEGESYRTVGCDCCSEDLTIKEIIGHPVMIGDVLDWIGDKRFYCGECRKLVDGRDVSDDGLGREYYCDICNNDYIENTRDYIVLDRDKKRLPIDEQSDGCIDYVYGLIQKD